MSDENDLKQLRFILGALIILNILDIITTALFMFIEGTTNSESNIIFTLLGGGTMALIFVAAYKVALLLGFWFLRVSIVAVSGARSVNLLFLIMVLIGVVVIVNNSYTIITEGSLILQQPAMKIALDTKDIHVIGSAFMEARDALKPNYDVWVPAENIKYYFWFILPGIIALVVWLFHNHDTSVKGKKTLFFKNGWAI